MFNSWTPGQLIAGAVIAGILVYGLMLNKGVKGSRSSKSSKASIEPENTESKE